MTNETDDEAVLALAKLDRDQHTHTYETLAADQ